MTSMNASLLIPHFGYDDEYDMSALVEMRSRMKKQVKYDHGIKLSFMPFIIKATSLSLSKYPILNSQVDVENENLVYKVKLKVRSICLQIRFFTIFIFD